MLDELRALVASERATPAQRAELARALLEHHWRRLRRDQRPDEARAFLDELRALCRQPGAAEAERFELAKALGGAHWDAVRHGDAKAAARLLVELQDLARRAEATEGQRWALAEALANEVRYHSGPRGDEERVDGLLRDLRRLAGRPHATELQRDALSRALLHLHHAARCEPQGERRKASLRVELGELAVRDAATAAQRLAVVEALYDTSFERGRRGDRRRQDVWLQAVRAAEGAADTNDHQRELFGDALVRLHAKVRRAQDDAFADRLLDRLRAVAVRPEASVEQWLALATALCDGLWIAGRFSNRDLAEELLEVLDLLTGDVGADTRQRMYLAGLLVGAHHRAVRSKDSLLSKGLLNRLWSWSLRPEATPDERSVLAHGLSLAHDHARAVGDAPLAAKVLEALRTLVACKTEGRDVERALDRALVGAREDALQAGDAAGLEALEAEIESRRRAVAVAVDLGLELRP